MVNRLDQYNSYMNIMINMIVVSIEFDR